jgi:outer membrane protein assembly factor BamB
MSPIIVENLIFTISNEGFLFVIEKNNGNIIRITDVYIQYKKKNRSQIKPIGFAIGNQNLYLTNSDGKIIIVDLSLGSIIKIEKVSGNLVSKPLVFENNLYLIRNGTIDKYN